MGCVGGCIGCLSYCCWRDCVHARGWTGMPGGAWMAWGPGWLSRRRQLCRICREMGTGPSRVSRRVKARQAWQGRRRRPWSPGKLRRQGQEQEIWEHRSGRSWSGTQMPPSLQIGLPGIRISPPGRWIWPSCLVRSLRKRCARRARWPFPLPGISALRRDMPICPITTAAGMISPDASTGIWSPAWTARISWWSTMNLPTATGGSPLPGRPLPSGQSRRWPPSWSVYRWISYPWPIIMCTTMGRQRF